MPNGDEEGFDPQRLDIFFSGIAAGIESFATEHGFDITRYYHNSCAWSLHKKLPNGSGCLISIREWDQGSTDSVLIYGGWNCGKRGKQRTFDENGKVVVSRQSQKHRAEYAPQAVRKVLAMFLDAAEADWNKHRERYGG